MILLQPRSINKNLQWSHIIPANTSYVLFNLSPASSISGTISCQHINQPYFFNFNFSSILSNGVITTSIYNIIGDSFNFSVSDFLTSENKIGLNYTNLESYDIKVITKINQ